MLSFFLFPPLCRTFENDRPKHTFKNINQKVLLLLKYKYLNKISKMVRSTPTGNGKQMYVYGL